MRVREIALWLAAAVAAALAIVALLPRAYPLYPRGWRTTHDEARAIGLQRARALGPVSPQALVSVEWQGDLGLELALLQAGPRIWRQVPSSLVAPTLAGWAVRIYEPGAIAGYPTYEIQVSTQGKVTKAIRNLQDKVAAGPLPLPVAVERARAALAAEGLDAAAFGPPEPRSEQRLARTDVTVRFPVRQPLGGIRQGVDVHFLGDQPGGFAIRTDAGSDEDALAKSVAPWFLAYFASEIVLFLLLIVMAIVFTRKYHLGEVGVRRAMHLFVLVALALLTFLALYPLPLSEATFMGGVSRRMSVAVTVVIRAVFGILPIALLAALAWSVGESWARERWGSKLAGFDALFSADWRNATVARSSLRGIALGLALLATLLGVTLPLHRFGVYPLASLQLGVQLGSSGWLGVGIAGRLLGFHLASYLVSVLFLGMAAARKLPRIPAALVAGVASVLAVIPPVLPLPLKVGVLIWILYAIVPVAVFLATDLLTALLCGLTAVGVMISMPLLLASTPSMQLQGWLPLLVLALPLLVSIRELHGGREFVYHWEDVPPHVRRIAERERQRVELETARQIQSSILPELPPQLGGVALAHAYLPATEVGGDFYDVLALEDGRVALAVGDVAGHGVSSGLVMSMVRSALAVQVTFDPEVDSVFATLNRLVFQSARRRLLTTLTYALLDPARRELVYASAGHVFPYRITKTGRVIELEGGSYPLGVRLAAQPTVRRERLEEGDFVVLLSDGVPEGHREDSDEPFGFVRLAESLGRHAGGSPEALVRGVLSDLESFTRRAPREDDVTMVALRLPG